MAGTPPSAPSIWAAATTPTTSPALSAPFFSSIAGAGIWYQFEGTLTLTAFAGIDASAGTLSGLRMIEVTIDNDFTSTPVPGGTCIEFADEITWDFVGGDGDGDGDTTGG